MGIAEYLSTHLMPPGMSPRDIFSPAGRAAPKGRDLLATYQGPGRNWVLGKLEQAGHIDAGSTERAIAGARSHLIAGGAGAAAVTNQAATMQVATEQVLNGVRMVPVNPIYQSPLYASLNLGDKVRVPMMAETLGSAAGVGAVGAVATAGTAVADAVAPTAGGVASKAERALMKQFDVLSKLPNADRPAILADAIDAIAKAGAGPTSTEVLTRALIGGSSVEHAAPALKGAIQQYAAHVGAAAMAAASGAAKVATSQGAGGLAAFVRSSAVSDTTAAISRILGRVHV